MPVMPPLPGASGTGPEGHQDSWPLAREMLEAQWSLAFACALARRARCLQMVGSPAVSWSRSRGPRVMRGREARRGANELVVTGGETMAICTGTGEVEVLTALYALHHGVAISGEDREALSTAGQSLSPSTWRHTVGLLREADGLEGLELDLGFTPHVLQWLGYPDEAAFRARHGCTVSAALARDGGQLWRLGRILEGSGSPVLDGERCALTTVWCDRADRLLDDARNNALAARGAILQALRHCPPAEDWQERLSGALERVDRILASLRCAGSRAGGDEAVCPPDGWAPLDTVPHAAAAALLSILWSVSRDTLLLDAERALDRHIPRAVEVWTAARCAVAEGRIDDIPLPCELCSVWGIHSSALPALVGTGTPVPRSVLRGCLVETHRAGELAEIGRLVDDLWGGGEAEIEHSIASQAVVAGVFRRRAAIEDGFDPVSGAPPDMFLEAFQGAQRAETVGRVELIGQMYSVLMSVARLDPLAGAFAHMDFAAAAYAQGEWARVEHALVQAAAVTARVSPDSSWWRHGSECLGVHRWSSGEVAAARAILEELGTPRARTVLGHIASQEPQRAAAAARDREWERSPSSAAGFARVWAHRDAGHAILAMGLATQLPQTYPDEPLAWATLAQLLCQHGRYRSAYEPARTALALGYDSELGGRLLATIEAGMAGQLHCGRVVQ